MTKLAKLYTLYSNFYAPVEGFKKQTMQPDYYCTGTVRFPIADAFFCLMNCHTRRVVRRIILSFTITIIIIIKHRKMTSKNIRNYCQNISGHICTPDHGHILICYELKAQVMIVVCFKHLQISGELILSSEVFVSPYTPPYSYVAIAEL